MRLVVFVPVIFVISAVYTANILVLSLWTCVIDVCLKYSNNVAVMHLHNVNMFI